MSLLIDATLRSSIVLVASLGLRACLRRRAAAVRHVVLAIGLASAAAVGPLGRAMPSWHVSVGFGQPPAAVTASRPHSAPVVPVRADTGPSARAAVVNPWPFAWSSVMRVWTAGCLVTLAVLAFGLLRVRRIASRARLVEDDRWVCAANAAASRYGLRRKIVILQTATTDILATCGLFRPWLLLPAHAATWTDDRIQVVLCHELAHVRRFDWPIQIAADIVRAVFWFNPLAWIVCALLRRDSEQACDDLVLGRGIAPGDYATHLLELARACRPYSRVPLPAAPMARRSMLERRISDMLNPHIDRQFSVRTACIAAALLLVVTIPSAALRAAQTGPATLSGTVYDPTGAVLPGVALTLEDVTQMKYEARTTADGRFAFLNVQPGHYTLSASLAGFRALQQAFDLAARPDWDRAITLQIGDLRESITVQERRGPAAPAPAAAAAHPIRVGGGVRAPLKTYNVKPLYPQSMRDAGREGVVPIEATIGIDGTVTMVRVLSAQVHPDFAIAAVDAVRQWRFTPTLLNGTPVEVMMNVSVTFTLSDQ